MVDALIRSFIGQTGSTLLDFYIAHSLTINGILLLYAAVLFASRRTYSKTRRALIAELEENYGYQMKKKRRSQLLKTLKKTGLPWQVASQASRFPLITGPTGFLIYPKTLRRLKGLFDIESLADSLYQG